MEDWENLVKLWREFLDNRVEILWAKTLEEGQKLFKENPDIELVVMDCCVPGDVPNSDLLVKEIRESGFTKPIIARSSMAEYCQTLLDVGADYPASSYPPNEVPDLVLKLLSKK